MANLEELIPTPRLVEVSSVSLGAAPATVWEYVRHGDLGESPLVRALFAVRTLPTRLSGGEPGDTALRLDDFRSTRERPGFQLLAEEAPYSISVGAIGKVWQLDIPFRYVEDLSDFAAFDEPDWIKVAWEIRIEARGAETCELFFEVRVDATSEEAWEKFRGYWRIIGPGSHFVRRVVLAGLKRRFGAPSEQGGARLPGDELLSDAQAQHTESIVLEARPAQIWPWLVQMGCRRAGFYSIDALDNAGIESAREIHAEWQDLRLGQVIPSTPTGTEGFEVLAIEPERMLVLGGLFDVHEQKQLPFRADRPSQHWQVTWAFVLEPVSEASTRLHVRARVHFSPSETLHLRWIRPVHSFMQHAQLHNLAARVEGRLHRNTMTDIGEGLEGALIIALALFTPFLRSERNHFGMSAEEAARARLGDELILEPTWSWTHGIEIDATPEEIWPWLIQMGADRAGFYSYQWLEDLVGCELKNAETIHPEWALTLGDKLYLHPKLPPLPVVRLEPGRALVVFGEPDAAARRAGRPWAAASWAFLIEPQGPRRSRLVSRFRTACSPDLKTRLAQGPALLEPIGFAMDRRMLLGLKERVEKLASVRS